MSQATAPQAAAYCAEAGMGPADPLRLALVLNAQSADELKGAVEKIGREAGQRAAQVAGQEIRSQLARLVREVSWVKAMAVAGLVVVTAGVTWFAARQAPMATPYGRMTPAQAETMRWNDLGALLNDCQRGAPQGGREWCGFTRGWWLSPPPQPK